MRESFPFPDIPDVFIYNYYNAQDHIDKEQAPLRNPVTGEVEGFPDMEGVF